MSFFRLFIVILPAVHCAVWQCLVLQVTIRKVIVCFISFLMLTLKTLLSFFGYRPNTSAILAILHMSPTFAFLMMTSTLSAQEVMTAGN